VEQYCDVFDRMQPLLCNRKLDTPVVAMQPQVKYLSLLGNGKLNTSMDTLAGPVLLRCVATSSKKASVSVWPAE
jgi:hypothetical protein